MFDKSHYQFKVLEGDYSEADIGTIQAKDGDFYEAGRVTYEISKDYNDIPVRIEPTSGMITISGSLDREALPSFDFEVIATDHGEKPLDARVNVTVKILDENDNQPLFYGYNRLMEQNGLHTVPMFSAHIPSYRVEAGLVVTQVFANDSDDVLSGNGAVEFRILDHSNIFYVHPTSGEVTTLIPVGKNRLNIKIMYAGMVAIY